MHELYFIPNSTALLYTLVLLPVGTDSFKGGQRGHGLRPSAFGCKRRPHT